MKRTAIVSLLWVLTIAIAAGVAYRMGRHEVRTYQLAPDEIALPLAESQGQVLPPAELEIAQPLTESQREMLLHAPSVSVMERMAVIVSEPGMPLQQFMAQGKLSASGTPSPGKLDLPQRSPTKDPRPPLNNTFNDDKPRQDPKVPEYVPYPCQVRDSRGELVWGVCFRRKV